MHILVHFKSRDDNLLRVISLVLATEDLSKEENFGFLN